MSGILARSMQFGPSFDLAQTNQLYYINKQKNDKIQQLNKQKRINQFRSEYRNICSQESSLLTFDQQATDSTETFTRVSLEASNPLKIQIEKSHSCHQSPAASLDDYKDIFISNINTFSSRNQENFGSPAKKIKRILHSKEQDIDRYQDRFSSSKDKFYERGNSSKERGSNTERSSKNKNLLVNMPSRQNINDQSPRNEGVKNQNQLFLQKCFASKDTNYSRENSRHYAAKSNEMMGLTHYSSSKTFLGSANTSSTLTFNRMQNGVMNNNRKQPDQTNPNTIHLNGANFNFNIASQQLLSGQSSPSNAQSKTQNNSIIQNQQNVVSSLLNRSMSNQNRFLNNNEFNLLEALSDAKQGERVNSERERNIKDERFISEGSQRRYQRYGSLQTEKQLSCDNLEDKESKIAHRFHKMNSDCKKNSSINNEDNLMNNTQTFNQHLNTLKVLSKSAEKSQQISNLIDIMISNSQKAAALEKLNHEQKQKKKQIVEKQSPIKKWEKVDMSESSILMNSLSQPIKQKTFINSDAINDQQILVQQNQQQLKQQSATEIPISNQIIEEPPQITKQIHLIQEKPETGGKKRQSQFHTHVSPIQSSSNFFNIKKMHAQQARKISEIIFSNLLKIRYLEIPKQKISRFFQSFLSRSSFLWNCIFDPSDQLRDEISLSSIEYAFQKKEEIGSFAGAMNEFEFLLSRLEEYLLENKISDCVEYKDLIINGCQSLQEVALKLRHNQNTPRFEMAMNTLNSLTCNNMINKTHSVVDSLSKATRKYGQLDLVSPHNQKMNLQIEKQIENIVTQRQVQNKKLNLFKQKEG